MSNQQTEEEKRCEICDRNGYHQNDSICSQGLIGPKIKEWFDYDEEDDEEKCRFCLVKHDKTFNGGNYICDCDKCGESGCFDCVVGTPAGNYCDECYTEDQEEDEEPNECEKCDWKSYKYSTVPCETLGDGYYCDDCVKKYCGYKCRECKQLNTDEDEEKTVNDCLHKYECGCDKQTCMEMDGIECDTLCGNEYCKHYYDHRNDNCDCNGNDCPYCNP